jgi:hypothetical protein
LVTQECLDRYPLQLVEMPGQGDGVVDGINFHIGSTTGLYFPSVRLPAGVICEHCVLQWFWTVGACTEILVIFIYFKKIVGFTIIISLRVVQPIAQGCAPTEAVATVTRNRSSTAQMFPFFRRVPNPAKHSLKENVLRNEIDIPIF